MKEEEELKNQINILPNMSLIKVPEQQPPHDRIALFRSLNTKERKIQTYKSVLLKLP